MWCFFSKNPKRLHYLSKRQIENYLIDEQAIKSIVTKLLDAKKIKDDTLLSQWNDEDFNNKMLEFVELQKSKIYENFISELFINDSLITTVDIRKILKNIELKPLDESMGSFVGEMTGLISKKAFGLSQKTNSLVTEFETNWAINKVEMCDGRELLKSIRQWIQKEYKVSFSDSELIDAMDKIPDEINSLLIQLTKPNELKIEKGVS